MVEVNWLQFMKTWPATGECLGEIGSDNNMQLNKRVVLSRAMVRWLKEVEPLAAKLSSAQREVLCTDEESIINAMVVVYDLQPLNVFLNQAFDGDITNVFYE